MRKLFLLAAVAALLTIPALAEDTLTIGMTLSQTGPLNIDSLAQVRGFELWRDEVNDAGGLKVGDRRYPVRFVSYDDQSQGARVQQLYTRLIVQDKAQFLFSPYSSGLCNTAAVISEQYGRIMLITGGAEPKTYTLGNKYLVQTITSADHYLTGAINALESKSPHAKVAIVYSDDPFSKAVAVAAREQAKESGFTIVLDESYAPATTDFSPIINKIIGSSADALLGGGHYTDGATLARQVYDQKADVKFISLLVAPDSPEFASLGPAALGITVPSQWEIQATYKPQIGPPGADFVKAFEAKFKVEPDYHSAAGYSGGLLLQHAIEQAQSIDTDKVIAAFNAMDVTTFFGRFKIAADAAHHGLQTAHEMVLAQWQKKNGQLEREVVWPKAAQTADLIYPLH